MSTLGKVLLVINLLAAGGVVYLASQAWAKRQDHNVALLKLGLFEVGFPLETEKAVNMGDDDAKVPFNIPTASGRSTEELRVKVLKEHFGGAKGEYTSANPPASVIDELKEVQKNVEAKANGFKGNPKQGGFQWLIGSLGEGGRLTPGVLMLLADDFEERMLFREWLEQGTAAQNVADQQQYYDYAVNTLTRKFNEAVQKADPAAAEAHNAAVIDARKKRDEAFDTLMKAPLDQKNAANATAQAAKQAFFKAVSDTKTAATSDLERRRNAAGLLVCLDTSAVAQKRTALVVGLKGYTTAVYDRVARLRAMPERFERTLESDLAQFVVRYEERLDAAKALDRLLAKQKTNRQAVEEADAHAKKMLEQRTGQRDVAKKETGEYEVKTANASKTQADIEKTLFELQKQVGALLVENFALEDKLIQAEQKKAAK